MNHNWSQQSLNKTKKLLNSTTIALVSISREYFLSLHETLTVWGQINFGELFYNVWITIEVYLQPFILLVLHEVGTLMLSLGGQILIRGGSAKGNREPEHVGILQVRPAHWVGFLNLKAASAVVMAQMCCWSSSHSLETKLSYSEANAVPGQPRVEHVTIA